MGYSAFRMAAAGFLIPFMFITSPELLLIDASFLDVITKIPTAAIGTVALAFAIIGYWKAPVRRWERAISFFAGILLMDGGILTDVGGIALFTVVVVLNWKREKDTAVPQQA